MHRFAAPLLAALIVSGAAACSNDKLATSPTAELAATSGLANPDVSTFQISSAGTDSAGSGPCTFDDTTGQFSCPDVTRDGVTFTRTFAFFDASGNPQSKFDPATTASTKLDTSAKGTITGRNQTTTIDRTGEMITSGLAGAETSHTLNGTEQGTVVTVSTGRDGTQTTVSTTIADSTNSLVVPVPSKDNHGGGPGGRFPLSGSQTHSTTTTTTHGSDTQTNSFSRTETFDGTSVVRVDITKNGTTQHCTIDLEHGTNTCGM